MRFHVLGPLRVEGETGLPLRLDARKPRLLLLTMLSRANQWRSGDALADALWPAGRPDSAAANLKTYVWQLRGALAPLAGPDRIESRVGDYRLRAARSELDAWVFEDLAGQGRDLIAHEPVTAAGLLSSALAMWRGAPYEELSTEVARVEVARLTELRRAARNDVVDTRLALGDYTDAISTLRAMTAEDPLHEPTWCRLLHALHASGRRAEALSTYLLARAGLGRELGVEPGPELRQAYQRAVDGAPPAAPARPRGALAARRHTLPRDVPAFVGRHEQLAAVLEAAAAARGAVSCIAIEGMAGIGKTAVALHAARLLAPDYADGQLFLDLRACSADRPPLSPSAALGALLRLIGVCGALPRQLADRAALWRAAVTDRRLLIVLDDASGTAALRPLLPVDSACLVIVTSRRRLADPADPADPARARRVSLDVLPRDAAISLLEQGLGADRLGSDPVAAGEIASFCGGVPLAIQIAAARLRHRPTWPLAHLADRLRDEGCRLAELRTESRSMAASFDCSYRQLRPDQRRLLRLLGLAPAGDVDVAAAASLAGLAPGDAERLLDQLRDRHLVERRSAGPYAVHDLVRLFARTMAWNEVVAVPVAVPVASPVTSWRAPSQPGRAPVSGSPAAAGRPLIGAGGPSC